MTMSGVLGRPLSSFSRCTSCVVPGGACFLHHSEISVTAFSMWPFSTHFGSKNGDLFGMPMYCEIVGTISFSQNCSVEAAAALTSRGDPDDEAFVEFGVFMARHSSRAGMCGQLRSVRRS